MKPTIKDIEDINIICAREVGGYEIFKQTYSYIFNDWLTESEHGLCNERNCFEIYLNRDPRRTKPENLRTEIFIPIN